MAMCLSVTAQLELILRPGDFGVCPIVILELVQIGSEVSTLNAPIRVTVGIKCKATGD